MWETWVPSLGWEDPLEKGKVIYLLQYSGLENSMVSIVYGVAKSQTHTAERLSLSVILVRSWHQVELAILGWVIK